MGPLIWRHAGRLPGLLAAVLFVSLAVLGWSLWQWRAIAALNTELDSGTLQRRAPSAEAPELAYAIGHLQMRDGQARPAARALTLAEAAQDPALRARAKLALGNLYFDLGLKAADVATGGSHVGGNAQIDLAREAYRSALRSDPQLHAARYNLELLDRLSPPRRTEGWERSTDGVTLAPQKRDGWASMKDNVRRGLP